MSEPHNNVEEQVAELDRHTDCQPLGPSTQESNETPRPEQLWLSPASYLSSAEPSPSPSGEGSALLSLPWEMVARIASHLPAQCVITVLPRVCHALGNVCKDSTAWQLRARRLTGPRACFPVGPRDNFDWPTACVEMEQLITCWAGQGEWATREAERDRERQGDGVGGERGAEGPEVGDVQGEKPGKAQAGVEALAQEAGFVPEEVRQVALEDGERERHQDGGPPAGGRQKEGEQRQEADMVEEREERGVMEAIEVEERVGVAERQEGGAVDREREPARSPSPPPALEHISLPSGHIAEVNSVLLVGGEGAVCASGSRDRNVNLWNLREGSKGALLRTLGGQGLFSTHLGWVWCLASRDNQLASGSFDSTVRLWDLGSGGTEQGLIRTKAAVLCLSFQSDVLLAGTYDKKVSIYDTRVAEPLVKSLRLHGNAVLCLAANENYIISGSKDHTVAIYDRRAGKPLQKLQLSSYLLSMCYSGGEVWAGDNRGMLHSFSVNSGALRPVSQFDVGHTSLVTGIHRSPGTLYTCSSDRTIKVHLPCAPPRTLCTLRHQASVNGLSVEAGVLAIASGDMCVEVWKARK
ncbi:F-box/WD repeat-containing protein 9 [Osmerus mordax]|uniref:F-box/WD repeat-containing protein 9 n=1 Tax=Osmerus mordax TaxID=8014 RepID=UPI00350EC199